MQSVDPASNLALFVAANFFNVQGNNVAKVPEEIRMMMSVSTCL